MVCAQHSQLCASHICAVCVCGVCVCLWCPAGIDIHPMTLEVNFKLPFMREFLLLHGVVDASKTACLMVLGKGSGQAILLAVGGAQEALLAQPGTYDVVSLPLLPPVSPIQQNHQHHHPHSCCWPTSVEGAQSAMSGPWFAVPARPNPCL